MKSKKGLNLVRSWIIGALTVFLLATLTTTLVAVDSIITLTGEVAAFHTLNTVPLNNTGIVLTNTNINIPVARLDITSNQINGFKLTFSTTNGFKMKYNTSELSYSLRLQRESGSLANGIQEPSGLGLSSAGALIFGGTALSGITNVSYNLLYNSTPTGLLAVNRPGETYSDTITITISDI